MATYRVSFDGKWQGEFDNRDTALTWAQEVGDTGRLVHLAEQPRFGLLKLIAVFPESRTEEGERAWKRRSRYVAAGT